MNVREEEGVLLPETMRVVRCHVKPAASVNFTIVVKHSPKTRP